MNTMQEKVVDMFYPESKEQWRNWLQNNHVNKESVWLIFYKKNTKQPTLSWSEAVDEALCFGWIDSVKKTLDSERSIQFFSKRKAKSTWSKINKQKVQQLIEKGLMTKAGHDCIAIAKQNGSWELLDDVEELMIPADLAMALQAEEGAMDFFVSLSKSVRKAMLQWLVLAKRETTRQKRIKEIATLAGKKQKPGFY